jgi:glucan biosynthesis protein
MGKRRKHNDLWVTRDGVIGFGEITLFDTEGWSEKDIALVEWAHPSKAHKVAKQVSRKYEVKKSKKYSEQAEDAFLRMFRDSLGKLRDVDVRAYIIDEDGVTEVDPDTDEPLG